MRRSVERILTTHTGSLPRPPRLVELLYAREDGDPVDAAELAAVTQAVVAELVQQQRAAGVDIISDGEASKSAFVRYVKDRLSGFGGESHGPAFADLEAFPDFGGTRAITTGRRMPPNPACEGPVTMRDAVAIQQDIANLTAALGDLAPGDCFLPAASPGVIAMNLDNHYYPTHEAYITAIADAMRHEYHAITDAGFLLQLDCPDLAMGRHRHFKDRTLDEFRAHSLESVAVLNHALAGIPPEQVRLHLCWGNYEGPHTHDVELQEILDVVLHANVGAISIEAANPRHEHEWQVFREVPWPEEKVLIPGVIDSTTNFVEHPKLVAERIVRFAQLIGREHVIAGTDCGFSTAAGWGNVAPGVVWAKLASLSEGARLASAALW
jgi:5-methyltetrahydropteroyltriglutamate--homocysteine methyltransferase